MRLPSALLLVSVTLLQAQSPHPRAVWWQDHADPQTWPAAATTLEEGLARRLQQQPTLQTVDAAFLDDWTLARWLRLASPPRNPAPDPAAIRDLHLLGSAAQLFVTHLHPRDKTDRALALLLALHKADPEAVQRYPALAVATALVHDTPCPFPWPHHQVSASDLPGPPVPPVDLFLWFVEASRKRKLLLDPATLSVTQLKFLVDTRLPLSELDWARQEIRANAQNFDKVFGSIRYDRNRIVLRQYKWNGGPYTLANIQKNGGICVDQAHFAATAGKAHGLPTLYFRGQGNEGGHAWFGYLRDARRWELDCGRYESQNYPVGHAIDPQTWEIINDAELEFLTGDLERQPNFAAASALLSWTQLHPGDPLNATLRADIRQQAPYFVAAWRAEQADIASSPVATQKTFWEAWIRQFNRVTDLKLEGQNGLLEVLKKEGLHAEATTLQKQILQQNRRKRFDLGIGAGADLLFTRIEDGDWAGADREFKSLVRKFDDKGGGHLFYQVVRPYVLALAEEGRTAEAEKSLAYVDKKLRLDDDSILAMEIAKLRAALRPKPGSAP